MVRRTHHTRDEQLEASRTVEPVHIRSIDSKVLPISTEVKNARLIDLISALDEVKVVVFCRSRNRSDTLTKRLRKDGIKASGIHTGRSKSQRARAIANYAEGNIPVLVAMHSLAGEIEFGGTKLVVNYDVPAQVESYTELADADGRGAQIDRMITFVTHDDYLDLRAIEAALGEIVPTLEGTGEMDLGDEPPVLDADRKLEGAPQPRKTRAQAKEEAVTARAKRRAASEPVTEAEEAADLRPGRARRRRRTAGSDEGATVTEMPVARTISETEGAAEGTGATRTRGGAKKRGKKGAPDWEYVATEADMAGMGITWGVRQKKGEGRKQIPLEEIKAELELYALEHAAAEAEKEPEPIKHSWDAMAAELAGLTVYAPTNERAAGTKLAAGGGSIGGAKSKQRRRRKRRAPKSSE